MAPGVLSCQNYPHAQCPPPRCQDDTLISEPVFAGLCLMSLTSSKTMRESPQEPTSSEQRNLTVTLHRSSRTEWNSILTTCYRNSSSILDRPECICSFWLESYSRTLTGTWSVTVGELHLHDAEKIEPGRTLPGVFVACTHESYVYTCGRCGHSLSWVKL